jgi:hypothetical protein
LITDNEGYLGVFAVCDEGVGRGGDGFVIGPREVGEVDGKVAKDAGNGVASLQEFGVWSSAETGEGVR